jgi:hypothetical protein
MVDLLDIYWTFTGKKVGVKSSVRNNPDGSVQDEDTMDIPVEIELRLKKTKIQKRKFVPSIKNNPRRKKAKQ